MRLADIKQYALDIATNHLQIAHTNQQKHFLSFTVEDGLTSIKDITGVALMLELPEFSLSDTLSDNVRLLNNSGMLILKKAKQGDYVAVQSVYDATEPIAFDILTKFQNDRRKALSGSATGAAAQMKHLDVNTLSLVDVGPVFDGWYGWRINLQFNSPISLRLNPDRWQNETVFTL